MAQDGKDHRMVFDIRGRRRNVVKVVYATLAVLMGLSLFLVVGGFSLGELFSSANGGSGDAAKTFEEQAERLEAKLRKDPENPDLLLSLTRARATAGNTLLSVEADQEDFTQGLQQYQLASANWAEYLEVTEEPNAGIAQLMAPTLFALAEGSRTYPEAQTNLEAATDAQRIVAQQRPNLNSLSTLAIYALFTGDSTTAKKAEGEAHALTKEKFERDELDKQLEEVQKNAAFFQKERKKAEKAAKAGGGNAESLETPANPFSGSAPLGE
jgi:hypothetical protein